MKKFNFLLLLLLTSIILITSCNKDANDPNNEFKYNGSTKELDKGFIEYFGEIDNDTIHFHAIYLVTQNIIHNSEGDFAGTGDGLFFEVVTSDEFGLVEGTYIWSQTEESFTMNYGSAIFDANIELETGTEVEFASGSIDITLDGDQTILEFDITTVDSKSLTGSFKGELVKI